MLHSMLLCGCDLWLEDGIKHVFHLMKEQETLSV